MPKRSEPEEDTKSPKLTKDEKEAKKAKKSKNAECRSPRQSPRLAAQAMAAAAVPPMQLQTAAAAAPAKAKALAGAITKTADEREASRVFCKKHEIVVHDPDAPLPLTSLAAAPFPLALVKLLLAQPGFTEPSAVQGAAWPIAVMGIDVLAVAKTGSGKTLGYLLPALARWHECRGKLAAAGATPSKHPFCLVRAWPPATTALRATRDSAHRPPLARSAQPT